MPAYKFIPCLQWDGPAESGDKQLAGPLQPAQMFQTMVLVCFLPRTDYQLATKYFTCHLKRRR